MNGNSTSYDIFYSLLCESSAPKSITPFSPCSFGHTVLIYLLKSQPISLIESVRQRGRRYVPSFYISLIERKKIVTSKEILFTHEPAHSKSQSDAMLSSDIFLCHLYLFFVFRYRSLSIFLSHDMNPLCTYRTKGMTALTLYDTSSIMPDY